MNRQNEFQLLLKLHRQQLSKTEKSRVPKPLITQYPVSYEYDYFMMIQAIQNQFIEKALAKIRGKLKSWLHMDSFGDDINNYKNEMDEELVTLYGATFFWGSRFVEDLKKIASNIYGFDKEQWNRQLSHILGMSWATVDDWWLRVQEQWVQINYQLIRNLSIEFINKTNVLLTTAIQSMWNYKEIDEALIKLSNVFLGYRSSLIARDQTGNLNAAIWANQYAEIGLDEYIWHTWQDERVRGNPTGKYPKAVPSHFVMHGLTMKWSDMSVFSPDNGVTWKPKQGIQEPLHVGMAIACRCTPLPSWGSAIAKADAT